MKKYVCIIYFMVILLLLTSCETNLDVKIKRYIDNNCECTVDVCQCLDTYNEENVIYVDCSDVDITSMSDVIKRCDYWNEIDGWRWESNNTNETENKTGENESII